MMLCSLFEGPLHLARDSCTFQIFFLLKVAWLPGSHHFVGARLCHWCCAPLPVLWDSFCQPQKDDRLNQLYLVLIQQPTGFKLRILRSQVSHPNYVAYWATILLAGDLSLNTDQWDTYRFVQVNVIVIQAWKYQPWNTDISGLKLQSPSWSHFNLHQVSQSSFQVWLKLEK